MIGKYVAFGIGYWDRKGKIIDEGKIYYVIKYDSNNQLTVIQKHLVKIFDTENDRDNWIDEQNYQYDHR